MGEQSNNGNGKRSGGRGQGRGQGHGSSRRQRHGSGHGHRNHRGEGRGESVKKSVDAPNAHVLKRVEEKGVAVVKQNNQRQLALVPVGHKRVAFSGVIPLQQYRGIVEFAEKEKTRDINSLAMEGLRYYILFQKIKNNIKYAVFGLLVGTGVFTLGKAMATYFGIDLAF